MESYLQYFACMLNWSQKHDNLTTEINRLKKLQKQLKTDIRKYKQVVNGKTIFPRKKLTDDQKKQLKDNFRQRAKTNAWILKKILHQARTLYH